MNTLQKCFTLKPWKSQHELAKTVLIYHSLLKYVLCLFHKWRFS